MHHLFRNSNPFVVIILFIAALTMKMPALLHPVMPVPAVNHVIFLLLLRYLHLSAFAYTLLSIVMVFLQAIYINFIAEKHKLFHKAGYYPAFMYILLTSLYPAFNYFSEPLFINWLVLIAFDIMLSFPKTLHPGKQLFNAGFAICLPALVQFPAVGFFLLLLIAILLLRSYRNSEMIVALLGYLTPVYFFAGLLYLTDSLGVLKNMAELGFDVHQISSSRIYLAGTITGAAFFLLVGLVAFQQLNSRMTIYIQRSWWMIISYLAVAVLVTLFAVSSVHAEWVLVLPPLSLISAQAFYMENPKRLSIFMFYFSLALLIFSLITFK